MIVKKGFMNKKLPGVIPLQPYCREMVWGGRRLAELYGKQLPADVRVGETFELSAYEYRESRAAAGPLRGRSLLDLLEQYRDDLVGGDVWARYGGRFPLLIKLLDAQQDLSIQVHPDDAYAQLKGLQDVGKMEAWYVLHSEGGRVAYGLQEGVGREDFTAAVAENRVEEVIRFYTVSRGDLVFSPPGTVHALCAGVVIYEVQQSSDLTFRIYDYDRPGLDGRPRELHIEQALEVIDFAQKLPGPVPYPDLRGDILVESQHFVLRGCGLHTESAEHVAEGSFLALTLVGGKALLSDGEGEYPLAAGATALVPAGGVCEIVPLGDEKLEYLIASVPT